MPLVPEPPHLNEAGATDRLAESFLRPSFRALCSFSKKRVELRKT